MNRRGRIALAVGLASTVAVIGGVTVSATAETDADATISACAKQTNGGLRLADECRRSEVPVSWKVEGPAGSPGPAELTVMPGSADRPSPSSPSAVGRDREARAASASPEKSPFRGNHHLRG